MSNSNLSQNQIENSAEATSLVALQPSTFCSSSPLNTSYIKQNENIESKENHAERRSDQEIARVEENC